ncbi:MAG: glycosyltransferase family 4 protein [Nitrospirota bacterium]
MSDMVIDVTRLLGRFLKGRLPTGVDRVSMAYMRHFGDRSRAMVRFGRCLVFPRPASRRLFDAVLNASPDFHLVVAQIIGGNLFSALRETDLTGALLFNTGHSGLERRAYPRQLRRLGVKPVFFVHDLIPITHPEYCRPGERDKHCVRMDNALQTASGVIVNSHATLDELGRYAARTGQAMPPCVVAPLAPPDLPAPSAVRPLAEPYFVMLGTIEPRKNHALLLQAWRAMITRMGEQSPRLVVIGQRGWECENVVDLLERCEPLRGIVTELPACSDADLATYLHHAQALLFPSFAEGYGMPLVEALSLGVPVIASDLPAFREIAGDVPDYLDPLDGAGWMERIEAFADPASTVRAEQLKRLSVFSAPTWTSHFRSVEEFLGQLG